MIHILLNTNFVLIISFIISPPIYIDGVHEPISGSIIYGNNITFDAIIYTFATINFHFYPIRKVVFFYEYIHNRDPMSQSFMSLMYFWYDTNIWWSIISRNSMSMVFIDAQPRAMSCILLSKPPSNERIIFKSTVTCCSHMLI